MLSCTQDRRFWIQGIRVRRSYPGSPGDDSYERNVAAKPGDINCSKSFATYDRSGFTGGFLTQWCPHAIFWRRLKQCIQRLLDTVGTPPAFLIYDFGRALEPYCMVRKAEYWRNTVFMVDSFHAKGHSKCGAACMAGTYHWGDSFKESTPVTASWATRS